MNGLLATPDRVDALGLAGGLLKFARILDQQVRLAGPRDGLNLAELTVLSALAGGHDSPTAVAKAVHMDPARITHIGDHLVSLGYLHRELDQVDRRRWRMSLTASGQQRAQQGRADVDSSMRRLLIGLTQDEVEGMLRALEGIRRLVAGYEDG